MEGEEHLKCVLDYCSAVNGGYVNRTSVFKKTDKFSHSNATFLRSNSDN